MQGLQVALNEFAQLVPVVALHVDNFDAVAVGAGVANHRGELDFTKARADFQLDSVAHAELAGGFEVSATKANGLYAGHC